MERCRDRQVPAEIVRCRSPFFVGCSFVWRWRGLDAAIGWRVGWMMFFCCWIAISCHSRWVSLIWPQRSPQSIDIKFVLVPSNGMEEQQAPTRIPKSNSPTSPATVDGASAISSAGARGPDDARCCWHCVVSVGSAAGRPQNSGPSDHLDAGVAGGCGGAACWAWMLGDDMKA